MYLSVVKGAKELLRIGVLEARPDGSVKFRLWFYKLRETRPHQPYVDFEIDYRRSFSSSVYANKAEGIYEEHLREIAEILVRNGVRGVSYSRLFNIGVLDFSVVFLISVLDKLGIRNSAFSRLGVVPELPRVELITVEYLGGYRFKIGGKEVEFGVDEDDIKKFYAELRLTSYEEAEYFARSLKAIGVYVWKLGEVIEFNSDSFFGLLAVTGAVPPGLTPIYRSDDLHIYAEVKVKHYVHRVRYYFAVKSGAVWTAVGGHYYDPLHCASLYHESRDDLEDLRRAVMRALELLGRPTVLEEPVDAWGNIKDPRYFAFLQLFRKAGMNYYIYLCGPDIVPFLKHAAKRMKAEPVEVKLREGRIVVRAGKAEGVVDIWYSTGIPGLLLAEDMEQTLVLYKSLKAAGLPVEITSVGVRVGDKATWALAAMAVEKAIEKGELAGPPAELAPRVELLKVYNAGGIFDVGIKMYAFRVSEEDIHYYYFAVKTGRIWRAAGGRLRRGVVKVDGGAARTIADVINAVYREMGVERKVEVRQRKNGTPNIILTNEDLELLGLTQRGADRKRKSDKAK